MISTLQDIRSGRETEIESLNLEIARIAEQLTPPVELSTTRLLGRLVKAKSLLGATRLPLAGDTSSSPGRADE